MERADLDIRMRNIKQLVGALNKHLEGAYYNGTLMIMPEYVPELVDEAQQLAARVGDECMALLAALEGTE